MFSFKSLQTRCEKNLLKYIDETNACTLLDAASIFRADELKQAAFTFVLHHYYELKHTEAFKVCCSMFEE